MCVCVHFDQLMSAIRPKTGCERVEGLVALSPWRGVALRRYSRKDSSRLFRHSKARLEPEEWYRKPFYNLENSYVIFFFNSHYFSHTWKWDFVWTLIQLTRLAARLCAYVWARGIWARINVWGGVDGERRYEEPSSRKWSSRQCKPRGVLGSSPIPHGSERLLLATLREFIIPG